MRIMPNAVMQPMTKIRREGKRTYPKDIIRRVLTIRVIFKGSP
jgi:hypothetical protein